MAAQRFCSFNNMLFFFFLWRVENKLEPEPVLFAVIVSETSESGYHFVYSLTSTCGWSREGEAPLSFESLAFIGTKGLLNVLF